ncbi:galactokinase [Polyangium aurulentum]|uniref:galactokinase n=1 Tax=Polyangium aurulentum TaxID=2567896 RepID=UPI0010AE58B5|nr:galactokinase [Polyangium aurulentum]UQA58846.1 galactokinase [Polyangium aurulentum]
MIDHESLRARFEQLHGRRPRLFQAPGRVNLIGEHTDYNDGFVLPMALGLGTTVAAAPREDRRVRVHSENLGASVEFDLDHPGPEKRGQWFDYVEGVAQALERSGKGLRGADLVLASDVPAGAGLSSSAALEISVGLAFLSLSGLPVDRVALARAGQAAEHRYVGTLCGLMDQLVAALGQEGAALLIDCRSMAATPVPMPASGIEVLITDTRKKHALATSEYNTRRAECERAVEILRGPLPGIRALRDVSVEQFEAHEGLLPEPVRRRARHIVTENARTLLAAEALGRSDLAAFGARMIESHRSMRDDFEISAPELDVLVDAALGLPGVYGARMTGGGFGGCTVTLVESAHAADVREKLRAAFVGRFGAEPGFVEGHPGAGALEIL